MGIFDGLNPKQQGKSIVDGAYRLEHGAMHVKESERWSIAELKLSTADIGWLKALAASLLLDQALLNLQYSTRSPKFGLLFLALAAEICRRETDESEAWPIIREAGWDPTVRSVLFNKQGAAKPLLCHAIEGACRQYGLRNILDQQEKQYWFTTIKLQFGMTRRGATSQLGDWLYFGTFPDSSRVLLEDPENRSASFGKLVDRLKAYQDGFVTESEVRRLLEDSPWIVRDGLDEILAAAREKPAAGRSRMERAMYSPIEPPAEEPSGVPVCDGKPVLVWHDGAPRFIARICDELDSFCTSDRFFVSVDAVPTALFLRQKHGGFAHAGEAGREINLPANAASTSVVAADDSSEPLAVELVQLYDPDADLQAWEEKGDRRSHRVEEALHAFEPSRAYTFRIPNGSSIEPAVAVSRQWSAGECTWIQIAKGWPADFKIVFEGAELFSGGTSGVEPVVEPAWTRTVSVQLADINWERGEFALLISASPQVSILGARVFGGAVHIAHLNERTVKSAPIAMRIHDPRGAFEIRIAAKSEGDRRIIRRKERFPLKGLWFNHDGFWRRHNPDSEVNVAEIRRQTCLVHVPRAPSTSERPWLAFEGRREVGVPVRRPGQPHGLAGWGQPLELAQGRYNHSLSDEHVELASRVIDRGCVLDCFQMHAVNSLVVRLQVPIEPSDEHRIIAWTAEGHLAEIGGNDIRPVTQNATWYVNRSSCSFENSGRFVAVALAYRNLRLGAWWADDWPRTVLKHCRNGRAKEAAQLLRWFQLPVLDYRYAGTIRALATEYGSAFAEAWLAWRDRGDTARAPIGERIEADDLRPAAADPGWYEVVRNLLTEWKPCPNDAERLISAFEQHAIELNERLNQLPMASLVEEIAQVAPWLTGRLVREWLSDKNQNPRESKALLAALADQVRGTASSQLRASDRDHGDDSGNFDPRVKALRLSQPFVDELLKTAASQCAGSAVEPHAAENLQRLLQHQTFSSLVTAHLLETLVLPENSIHVTA